MPLNLAVLVVNFEDHKDTADTYGRDRVKAKDGRSNTIRYRLATATFVAKFLRVLGA